TSTESCRSTRLPQSSPVRTLAGSLAVCAAANDVFCKSFEITLIIPLVAQQNSVSSRGWRSAPRDLTPAQALARYDRRALRLRRDGPLCDLIAAGGPSPSPRLGMTCRWIAIARNISVPGDG